MLKERDKKLMFYSWSYGILAAAIIYACCGYGVLAWETYQSYSIGWTGYNGGGTDFTITNITEWNNAGITRWYYSTDCLDESGGGYLPLTGSEDVQVWKAETTYMGNVHLDWTMPENDHWGTCTFDAQNINATFDASAAYGYKIVSSGKFITSGYGLNRYYENPSSPTRLFYHATPGGQGYGSYVLYSGSEIPVINYISADRTPACYEIGDTPVYLANVTGTISSLYWNVTRNSTGTEYGSSTSDIEWVLPAMTIPSNYTVYFEVNDGVDSETSSFQVGTVGTCNFTVYNPFPTVPTVTPTSEIMPTLTQPDYTVVNMTGVNDLINGTPFNESSMGYRSYIDEIGDQFNATLVQSVEVVTYPFTSIINGIATAISLFSSAINSLTVYTTVPLAITAIVINYMPWQIVTLITAGIAIDAILILVLGIK